MKINDYLKTMVQHDASDLYITVAAPPAAKFHGKLKALAKDPLSTEQVKQIAYDIMDDDQIRDFEQKPEMNLALAIDGIGRFRVNIFKQRGQISMVIRSIKTEIPSMNDLLLPPILKDLVMSKRGLILFVGATGSGKSTSLASLIDHRNSNSAGHIITVEDPIEFVHKHKKSIVNQREVGVDTDCYEDALKNTLRQAPDVILIGEVRDAQTMEHALAFAETGHLCLSTLHANNANQAIDRIINFFPEDRHKQILLDLSLNLRAFISQRLVPTVDNKRAAAIEILIGTPMVCDLIKRGDVHELKDIMERSKNLGMQTFDGALLDLHNEGRISLEEALKNADSANNLRLKVSLQESAEKSEQAESAEETDKPEEQKEEKVKTHTTASGVSLSLEEVPEDQEDDGFIKR